MESSSSRIVSSLSYQGTTDSSSSCHDFSRSEVINSKPIGNGLNVFRDSFKSLCGDRRVSTSVDGLQHIGPEGTYNGLYSSLSNEYRSPKSST